MRAGVFLFLLSLTTILVIGSHPATLRAVIPVSPTTTSRPATITPTATTTPTRTPDPLARFPTTTPVGGGIPAPGAVYVPAWPSPTMGMAPPTFTSTPFSINTPIALETRESPPVILPESAIIPTPAGPAPDRLQIPHLNLDVPIEPVGLVPSPAIAGGYEWEVPAWRAAGWLSSSAPFGASGNTVLDGHHNIDGEVFRDLWTLQRGDAIVLWAGNQARDYRVDEVLILPERDQPRAVRLANARYIQPTDDERLTLITCWPYEDNSHRAVVVAKARER